MMVQPFRIKVSQDVLDDLQGRLARTRWPDQVEGAGWDYGVNLSYLQELVGYWRQDFDWRSQEAMLNQFAQFRVDIDGVGLHFIHERGKGPNPKPLLLLHGWPDSFFRFYKLIPMLTDPARFGGDPAQSFDVIVPSLPGFGFSDKPLTRRKADVASLLTRLMTDVLGYKRFAVHGGDLGSPLAKEIGLRFREAVTGVHMTDIFDSIWGLDPAALSDDEQSYINQLQGWFFAKGSYNMVQSAMPQTLAYGLTDSPTGLAAWILHQFRAWSDSDGEVERRFTKDELLTNITIYWVTETLNSSIRWYFQGSSDAAETGSEEASAEWGAQTARVEVPVGVGLFPKDQPAGVPPPRQLAERRLNVQHWTVMPRGGHFAALEEPGLLADDLRDFFAGLS
jgi:pimeloyl-ACP methyl ester carboxylesterase